MSAFYNIAIDNTINIMHEYLLLRRAIEDLCFMYKNKLNTDLISHKLLNDYNDNIINMCNDLIISLCKCANLIHNNDDESLQISLLNNFRKKSLALSRGSIDSANSSDSNMQKMINGYCICKFIGKGASGSVYAATKNNKQYAIKIIYYKKSGFSKVNKFDVKKEIAIMKKLKHPNVVKLIDAIYDLDNNIMYIVMDYLHKGCIFNVYNNICNVFDKKSIIKYIRQITNGLIYLHKNDVIHRDIKPENILLDIDDNAVLVV